MTAAAKARALLLAMAKLRLAQQLVPFRLIVERNVEQAAPPVRTGRGASLRQDTYRALMPAAAVTTGLERVEQASFKGTFIFPPAIRINRHTSLSLRDMIGASDQWQACRACFVTHSAASMTACIGKGRRLMNMMSINEDMVNLLSSLVLTANNCNGETRRITRKKGVSEVLD